MNQGINKTITKLRVLYTISVAGVFFLVLGIVNYDEPYPIIWIISAIAGSILFVAGGILPNFMEGVNKVMCDSNKIAQIDAIGFIAAISGVIIMMVFSIVIGATIMGAGMMLWFYHPGAEIRQTKVKSTA